jgi:DNA-binding CsgD family transcriptional regulator
MVLGSARQVLAWNDSARRILENQLGSRQEHETAGSALTNLLSSADIRLDPDADGWLIIKREDRRSLVIHTIPTPEWSASDQRVLVILIDLNETPTPSPAALQRIFKLSPAEVKLALCIFRGETPTEIAANNGVKLATVRSQLASIFNKTQTKRQSQLVALLARVAILP